MGTVTYTKCDKCDNIIKENEKYVQVFFKTKGVPGNRKMTQDLCIKCFKNG